MLDAMRIRGALDACCPVGDNTRSVLGRCGWACEDVRPLLDALDKAEEGLRLIATGGYGDASMRAIEALDQMDAS